MSDTVWVHARYESAYGLLGVMARELCDGLREAGHDARMINLASDPHPEDGVFVFFNAPTTLEAFPRALWAPGSGLRAVQVFVDHPFAMPEAALDDWGGRNGLANLRVCLPCADDLHLLRMRWPGLRHAWMGHGIPASAVCGEGAVTRAAWDGREFDVVVTGSIVGEQEIREAMSRMSASVAGMVREVVAVMLADAGVGYLQALDLVMGSRSVITGEWRTAQAFWRVCVAAVNRARRVRVVRALRGLRVGVFGSEAWREVCDGSVSYAGRVGYEGVAGAFGQGRVALAWGPTQFVHSYSERLMLAMAAGSAAVSDDRLLVRRDFPGLCGLYDAARPDSARAACDALLGDPEGAIGRAQRARAWVGERCLWRHRVGAIVDEAGVMAAIG